MKGEVNLLGWVCPTRLTRAGKGSTAGAGAVGWAAAAMKLIFTHIPKCAGNSVVESVRAAGCFRQEAYYYAASAELATHDIHWEAGREEFLRQLLRHQQFMLQYFLREGADFVYGHLPYSPLAQDYFREHRWVTVVREPWSRFRSQMVYLAVRYRAEMAAVHGVPEGPEQLRRLVEILYADEAIRWKSAHALGLQLGGLGYDVQPTVDPAAMTANALVSLERYALIGETESLGAFYDELEVLLGTRLERREDNRLATLHPETEALAFARAFFEEGNRRAEIEEWLSEDRRIYEACRARAAGK